jgi:uncharacterized membrane protein
MEYTMQMMEEIDEALKDTDFCNKIAAAENAEAIRSLFLDKGIEVDEALATAAYEKMTDLSSGRELTPEEMDLVAGGCKSCFWGSVAGIGLLGGMVGGVPGAVIGGAVGCIVGCARGVSHDIKLMKGKKK